MSELYFRTGEMKGFTSIELEHTKKGYTNPIRELLQNALDASREGGNRVCKVNIYIEKIRIGQVPHIKKYKEVLKKAIDTAKEQGSYNENSKQRVAPIEKTLQQKELEVLVFVDDGIGIKQKDRDAILTGGVSNKGSEESGGSFGVGHLSSYSLSSLRYVLYAARHKDNGTTKTLYTGSPILAGYRDKDAQRGNRGWIVVKSPENEKDPEFTYPEEPPDFIKSKMDKLDTGTAIAVLGLSEAWGGSAEYAIVSNFFHAINHESLKITIHKNSRSEEISDDRVKQLVTERKGKKRARGDEILSGAMVFQAWQAIQEEGSQKTIELSNSDKICVFIRSDKSISPAIILVRNGMVVARHDSMLSPDIDGLRKDPGFEPFTVIIDVDGQGAPELFRLVKGAEGPHHNELQKGLLNRNNDEEKLKKLLKELSEKIKADHLKKIERDSFNLPLFTVSNKDMGKAIGINKSDGQSKTGTPTRPPKKPPASNNGGPGEGGGRPPPTVTSRLLKSKTAARYVEKSDKWEVRLRINPEDLNNDKDDTYLLMGLAEDNDNDKEQCTYLDFITAELNGEVVEISDDNKRSIKLGPLNEKEQYDLIAEIEKPDDIGNMKAALLPVLGLKRRKKSEGKP